MVSPILYGTVFYKSFVADTSPNDINRVEVKYKYAVFFGPQKIRIIAKQTNPLLFNVEKYDSKIYDDGKNICVNDNVQVKWENGNFAVVILYGEEQKPEIIEVNFEPKISITTRFSEEST